MPRTDGTRGVWKAPAGTEATLVNVQALDSCTDRCSERHANPLGINCLRNFPGLRERVLGCADARRRGPDGLRLEVYPGQAVRTVP